MRVVTFPLNPAKVLQEVYVNTNISSGTIVVCIIIKEYINSYYLKHDKY